MCSIFKEQRLNTSHKFEIKKILFSALLVFSIFLLLFGLQYISGPHAEEEIKKTIKQVIDEGTGNAPDIGERIQTSEIGLSYLRMYQTLMKGKNNGVAIIVRITGNTGPYPAVFYYTQQKGIVFCGLAGIIGKKQSTEYYGITDKIICTWTARVEHIAKLHGGKN